MGDVYIREPGVERCEHAYVCEHACRMGCRAYKPMVDRESLLELADNLDSSTSMLLKQNDLDHNRKRRGMRRDHAQSLMAASGRIREALGEVE